MLDPETRMVLKAVVKRLEDRANMFRDVICTNPVISNDSEDVRYKAGRMKGLLDAGEMIKDLLDEQRGED